MDTRVVAGIVIACIVVVVIALGCICVYAVEAADAPRVGDVVVVRTQIQMTTTTTAEGSGN